MKQKKLFLYMLFAAIIFMAMISLPALSANAATLTNTTITLASGASQTGSSGTSLEFIGDAIEVLTTLVTALGAGLAVWGVINLMEGYGNDNPGANAHG